MVEMWCATDGCRVACETMKRARCSTMTACLFSSSSATLANFGPSLPVTVYLLLVAVFCTLSVSHVTACITFLAPRLYVVVIMSVAVVFAMAFFLLPASVVVARHRRRQGRPSLRLVATFVRQNVVVVGILLFYVISSVPDLLRVINESSCWQAWTQCPTVYDVCAAHHVDLFYYGVRVLLTSILLLMCWSFRQVALRRNLFVTLGLATFAAAMSCLWFDTWLMEVLEILRDASPRKSHHHRTGSTMAPIVGNGEYADDGDDDEDGDNYNRTRACHAHNTTIDNLLDGYQRFFYPCTFELALLITHCVVRWYTTSQSFSTSSPSSSSSTSFSCQDGATDTSPLLSFRSTDGRDDVTVTSPVDVSGVGTRRRYCWMLVVITTTLVNVVYCLLTFLGVYGHVHQADHLYSHVRIWYETFYRALMTTVLLVGLVIAGSSIRNSSATSVASQRQSHSGVEYLVLFTSCAPVIRSLLTIIAYSSGTRDWITASVRTANILGQTVAILHVAVQTLFLFYAKNVHCREAVSSAETGDEWRRRRSQFRAVLIVTALSDIAIWLNDSFIEINLAYGYSFRRQFFYNYYVSFTSFGVPIAIFYYFNCALLCFDVYLNC